MKWEETLIGIRMERNSAVAYLKELLGANISISPDAISIDKQQDSKAVKIRIKTQNRQPIIDIAKKHDLEIKEEGDSIIIYERH
jgi:hypothetical protein